MLGKVCTGAGPEPLVGLRSVGMAGGGGDGDNCVRHVSSASHRNEVCDGEYMNLSLCFVS